MDDPTAFDARPTAFVIEADDHLRGVLVTAARAAGCAVIGQSDVGEIGLLHAHARRADLVITGLDLPGIDGLRVVRSLRSSLPDARALVVAGSDAGRRVIDVLEAGANGLVSRDSDASVLEDAIRQVVAGGVVLLPAARGRAAGAPDEALAVAA